MSIEGLRELNRRLDAVASSEGRRQILGTIALAAVGYSKHEAPRRTGNLSRTIRLGSVSDTSATIVAGGQGVGYARAVHEGSRAHDIVPRRKKILAWPANAGDRRLTGTARSGTTAFIFARRVRHPGTKPNRFMVRGIQRAAHDANLRAAVIKPWNDAA